MKTLKISLSIPAPEQGTKKPVLSSLSKLENKITLVYARNKHFFKTAFIFFIPV